LRLFPLDTDNPNGLLVAGLVPMVNLLAIGLWRMAARRVEPCPARVGAQVVGWGALAAAVACFLGSPDLFQSYIGFIESAVDPLARRVGLDYDSALSYYVVVPALLTTSPQKRWPRAGPRGSRSRASDPGGGSRLCSGRVPAPFAAGGTQSRALHVLGRRRATPNKSFGRCGVGGEGGPIRTIGGLPARRRGPRPGPQGWAGSWARAFRQMGMSPAAARWPAGVSSSGRRGPAFRGSKERSRMARKIWIAPACPGR
jgi:hypothetical protein